MAPNQKQGPYPSESIEENQYYRMIKMGTHFFFAPIFIIQSKCRTKKSTPIADESLKFESTLNINASSFSQTYMIDLSSGAGKQNIGSMILALMEIFRLPFWVRALSGLEI